MASSRVCGFVLRGRFIYSLQCRETCVWSKSIFKGVRPYATSNIPNMVNSRNSTMVLGLAGISVGALVGAGYSYHKLQKSRVPVLNSGNAVENLLLESLPDVKTSRTVFVASDNTGLKLKLFQYPTCPFCCKVRTFLDYYGFSYDVVEVNPVLRQQVQWSQYKKVPILLAQVEHGYQQLNDSSMIISALASFLHDKELDLQETVKFYPSISYNDDNGVLKTDIMNRYYLMFQEDIPEGKTKDSIMLERKWRRWADNVLVHVLSPNVYRTQQEALQAFNWFSEAGEWDKHFSAWERYLIVYVGAFAMWIIGKRLKKRHGLKDDVRQSLYDECNVWLRVLKAQGTQFLGGNAPNLADLAVYGVLSSIEGCEAFQDLLDHTKIGEWYNSVQQNVRQHAGSAVMNR